ncbi:BatD family protein [Pontibacter sp. G13]|uniref:BatD family protein n=1 Tax=Pontibacter sp. G13 TaxID=3074898 RepID=UPI00288C101A|nr:BatD family protein [Pontibacter sp. G13]WNJ17364.1 BatD family protein [Pontibacter sp. G13]
MVANDWWKYGLFGLLIGWMLGGNALAQPTRYFATATVYPKEVFPGQPAKVTIRVSTNRWFTDPLQIGNLQVENAFLVKFDRPLSTDIQKDGSTWPTLVFYYLLYPYTTGTVTFPELNITAFIPPEGDYKGRAYQIKTRPQEISVKDYPEGANPRTWLVASNVSVSEKWDQPLKDLKVGDVRKRTITIRGYGTLSSLIPPTVPPSYSGMSIYPDKPKLSDRQTSNNVNGVRIESYTYLLEQAGRYVLPEIEIAYWHPTRNTMITRSIPADTMDVAENDDLAMLQTLRDSLRQIHQEEELAENPPFSFMGMNLTQLLGWGLVLLVVGLVLGNWTLNLWKMWKARQAAYQDSEEAWFDRFRRSLKKGSARDTQNALYSWWDRIRGHAHEPVIADLAAATQTPQAEQEEAALAAYLDGNGAQPWSPKLLGQAVSQARKRWKNRRKRLGPDLEQWNFSE